MPSLKRTVWTVLAITTTAATAIVYQSTPPTVPGTVIRVIDGDTVEVHSHQDSQRIRGANIDAPEISQPWGPQAKRSLEMMILGKRVKLEKIGKDRYQRTIGNIYHDSKSINEMMIATGNAWAYRRYLDDTSLLSTETSARTARSGLWALPEHERIPPWEWRRM